MTFERNKKSKLINSLWNHDNTDRHIDIQTSLTYDALSLSWEKKIRTEKVYFKKNYYSPV